MRVGTQRDARLYSFGANGAHGLRRTNDDKRKAVAAMLEDAEWVTWSDREIARNCVVSHTFVQQQRSSQATLPVTSGEHTKPATERTYTTKHGTQAAMKTGAIGKTRPVAIVSSEAKQATDAESLAAEAAAFGDVDLAELLTDTQAALRKLRILRRVSIHAGCTRHCEFAKACEFLRIHASATRYDPCAVSWKTRHRLAGRVVDGVEALPRVRRSAGHLTRAATHPNRAR